MQANNVNRNNLGNSCIYAWDVNNSKIFRYHPATCSRKAIRPVLKGSVILDMQMSVQEWLENPLSILCPQRNCTQYGKVSKVNLYSASRETRL